MDSATPRARSASRTISAGFSWRRAQLCWRSDSKSGTPWSGSGTRGSASKLESAPTSRLRASRSSRARASTLEHARPTAES